MTPSLTLALTAGVLVAAGVYLLTERSLTRILMGVIVLGNGVNLLFVVDMGAGQSPAFIGLFPAESMADPLPQAMVLTAIVITMAVAAFVITMAYRSFQLNGNDEVSDDIEDARIRELAERDDVSDSFEDVHFSDTGEDVVSE